ncbi:MAG: hypothetical protein U1F43_39220 [Myxococcota bacterium]
MFGAVIQRKPEAQSHAARAADAGGGQSAVQKKELRGMSYAEGAAALAPDQKKDSSTPRTPAQFADDVVAQMTHKVGHLSANQAQNLRAEATAAKQKDSALEVVPYVLERVDQYMPKGGQ